MIAFASRAALFVIAILVVGFFYALNSGITCTNDGSHFALIKSLYENGSTELRDNAIFAGHDSSRYQDRIYSDRNPGTALISIVFLKVMSPLSPFVSELKLDPIYAPALSTFHSELAILMMIAPLCGALLFYLFARLLQLNGISYYLSWALSLAIVLSTLMLRYSTVLYSHILATALVATSYLLLLLARDRSPRRCLAFSAFLLGTAALVEHPVAVLGPLWMIAILVKHHKALGVKGLATVVVSGVTPLIPLFIYNQINFDNPLSIAHFYHAKDTFNHSVWTMFTPSQLIERLWELLFQVNGATSVFGSSVFLSVMVATGLVGLRKNMNWDIAFASTCFAVAILPAALFSGNSGYDRDYRQALFALPFLTPMIARGVTSLRDFCLRGERRQSILICLILIAAFIFSFWTQLQHVRHENQPDLGKMLINDFAAGRVVEILLGLLFVLWLLIRLIDLAKNNQRGVKLKILS